jgi:hypothetical protein
VSVPDQKLAVAKRRLRRHYRLCQALDEAYEAACREAEAAPFVMVRGRIRLGLQPVRPPSPPFPDDLRSLPCGARTRAGTPCKRTDLHLNGRCKLHGGLSTGPRTTEGMHRAAANLMLRWQSKFEPAPRRPTPAERFAELKRRVTEELRARGLGTP